MATATEKKLWKWSGETVEAPLQLRKPRHIIVPDLWDGDWTDEQRDRVFAVMALCPQHTFQILTKRPERMAEYLAGSWLDRVCGVIVEDMAKSHAMEVRKYCERCHGDYYSQPSPLPNVWLGTSVEDHAAADERIPHLLNCPAAVRFLSCEPLLGAVELCIPEGCRGCNHPGNVLPRDTCTRCGGTGHEPSIDWVIVGGESGPGARPCNLTWIRGIVEQCKDAGVPVFVKQLGSMSVCSGCNNTGMCGGPGGNDCHECGGDFRLNDPKGGDWSEWPEDLRVREFPEPTESKAPHE